MADANRSEVAPARGARTLALSGLLLFQVVTVAFFLFDVIADLAGYDMVTDPLRHNLLELFAVTALGLGVGVTAREIRRVRRTQKRIESRLRVASGAFFDLLQEHFESWALTPSERDVALLAIKGLSINEIAAVRETKDGTVKAQCNAIYSKAGVSGRPQLLSLFIEDLMSERLVPRMAAE